MRHQRDAPSHRHGVPVLQPLPAHDGARERHAGAAQGHRPQPPRCRRRRPRRARAGRARRQGRRLSGRALGRPAAAGRDRPRAFARAEDHALRRADLGARSGARRLGACRHARHAPRRHDHGRRLARDALRARSGGPRHFHGGRTDRRGGAAGADLFGARERAHAGFRGGDRKVTSLERFVDTFLNPRLMARYWPDIAQGMLVTVEIALAVVVTGVALGLALAVLRSYRVAPANVLIIVFVDMFRALPPLVLILIIYFGLPNVGVNLSSYAVLWLVLSLVLAAFAEEIFWAGILSVRRGQWDAARSTGLGFGQTLLSVILPQAVRLAVPPLTNRTIAITKNTALGSVIGVGEVINQAQTAVSFSGNATPLMMAALGYLIIFAPVVALGSVVEKRFAWRRA